MSTKTKGPAAERFREAKRQFERWRQGRRRPGRIPTGLWLLAAEAAEELGIEEAARQLQVPAERLRQWVEQLGLASGPPKSAATEFVELAPVPWGAPGECQVEIAEPSGRKLCISLKGSAVGQLASLLATLCGREVAP
ncbi:MAG: hypothetical protein R6V57_01135 [Vicinamibacterales bacterium]